jgi:drug/metabolite transporter (DMT)-like permease
VSATACFFGGLRYLPLAEGSAISFLAPVFAVLLAGPVLGERASGARLYAALGGFAGILLLMRPGSAVFHPAVVLLLGAAVSNAFYQVLTRKLTGDAPHTTLFYTAVVGAATLSLAWPFFETHLVLTWREAMFLLLLGLLAGLGHGLFITAFTIAPASLVAPFTYVQMIWATLYGYVIFGHLPDWISGVGMAVIVASGIALVMHERRRAA